LRDETQIVYLKLRCVHGKEIEQRLKASPVFCFVSCIKSWFSKPFITKPTPVCLFWVFYSTSASSAQIAAVSSPP